MLVPKAIAEASTGGVFFLHGEDEYRKSQAVQALLDRFSDPTTRDFNLDRLEGAETTVERLASVVATPPMMADWRVVHLRQAEAFATSAKARAVVLDAAKKPPPGLVFIVQARIPARSKAKFYKDLAGLATTAELKAIPEHETPAWIVSWARDELGTEVRIEAARAIVGALGSSLGVLVNEVRKLAEMVGPGAPVDVEAVRKGGYEIVRQDRWAWFDLVGGRRTAKAIDALPALVRQGESPVGLVNGLSVHLLRIGVAVEGGMGALQAVLPPYQRFLARRLAGQARQWDRDALARAVKGLRRLDQLLKASSLSGDGLLEEWLQGLALSGRARSPSPGGAASGPGRPAARPAKGATFGDNRAGPRAPKRGRARSPTAGPGRS